jgi:hypothetical protein
MVVRVRFNIGQTDVSSYYDMGWLPAAYDGLGKALSPGYSNPTMQAITARLSQDTSRARPTTGSILQQRVPSFKLGGPNTTINEHLPQRGEHRLPSHKLSSYFTGSYHVGGMARTRTQVNFIYSPNNITGQPVETRKQSAMPSERYGFHQF